MCLSSFYVTYFNINSFLSADLLGSVSELLDKLLDMDDNLLEEWSTPELVNRVCEALKQVR